MGLISQSLEDSLKNYVFVPDTQLKNIAEGTKIKLREEGRVNKLYPFFEKILLGIEIEQERKEFLKRSSTYNLKENPYFGVVLNFLTKEDDSIINTILKNKTINHRETDEAYFHSIIRYVNERSLYKKLGELGLNGVQDISFFNSRELIFKKESDITENDFLKIIDYSGALILPEIFRDVGIDFNGPYYKIQNIISKFDDKIDPLELKSVYDLSVEYRLKDIICQIEETEIFKIDKKARLASEKIRNGTLLEMMTNVDYTSILNFADELDKQNYYQLTVEERLKILNELDDLLMKGYSNSSVNPEIRMGYRRGIIGRNNFHNDVLGRLTSRK